jgi:hypothetical protein
VFAIATPAFVLIMGIFRCALPSDMLTGGDAVRSPASFCSVALDVEGVVEFGFGDTIKLEVPSWIVELAFVDNACAGG